MQQPASTGFLPSRWGSAASTARDRLLVPVMAVSISTYVAVTGDISEAVWMAREGQALLAGSPLVHPDHWSWSPQSWDFVPTSPAWQYFSALAWQAFGTRGLHLLAFATSLTCLLVLAYFARAIGAKPTQTVLALVFVFLVAGGALTARAGLPAFLVLLYALHRIDRASRTSSEIRRLGATVVGIDIVAVYVGLWLHASWALYVFALVVLQVLPLSRSSLPRRQWLTISAVGAATAIAAALLGPLGWRVWALTADVERACRGIVKEWKTPWANGPVWIGILLVCLFLLCFALVQAWRNRSNVTTFELLLIMFATGAMLAGAHSIRFVILGACALAPVLATAMSRPSRSTMVRALRERLGERSTEPYWRNVTSLLLVPLLPVALVHAATVDLSPDAALSALPAHCRLFSSDMTAKFVELYRPDVSVWIDGRQHYWGRERLLLGQDYSNGRPELVPSGTTCVMLHKDNSKTLRAGLDHDPKWKRVAQTREFIVWRSA